MRRPDRRSGRSRRLHSSGFPKSTGPRDPVLFCRSAQLRSLRGAREVPPELVVSVPAVGAAAGSVVVLEEPDDVPGAAVAPALPDGVAELPDEVEPELVDGAVVLGAAVLGCVELGGVVPDDVAPPGVCPGPAPPADEPLVLVCATETATMPARAVEATIANAFGNFLMWISCSAVGNEEAEGCLPRRVATCSRAKISAEKNRQATCPRCAIAPVIPAAAGRARTPVILAALRRTTRGHVDCQTFDLPARSVSVVTKGPKLRPATGCGWRGSRSFLSSWPRKPSCAGQPRAPSTHPGPPTSR